MKIRVYYNIYTVDKDDFATQTKICDVRALPEVLIWLQGSPYLEFLTLEVIPE